MSMSSSSFNPRTYGRRSLGKRKKSPDAVVQDAFEDPASIVPQPRKRRKVSVEVTEIKLSKERTPDPSTDIEDNPQLFERGKKPSVQRTYGSPKRIPKSPSPPLRSLLSTPRRARDLSAIFESLTPNPSPPPSPTKLAKRMLARSKTDSSIDGPTSPLSAHCVRTPSFPSLPSSPSRTLPSPSSKDTLPPPPPPIPISVTTRTYAGKSRSFLMAIPASSLSTSNSCNDPEQDEDDYSTRESYSSLRARWGVDNSEDDPYPPYPDASPSLPDSTPSPKRSPSKNTRGKGKISKERQPLPQTYVTLPNGMMNPLKSITELRSKGESRRFLDEVGYLFEGMDTSVGIGLRRASALQITMKLCDAEFSRKAKAADFLGRTWDVFGEAGAGSGDDKILDTLLSFFVALVSRDPATLADLAYHIAPSITLASMPDKQRPTIISSCSPLVDTLFTLLGSSTDPLALISSSPQKDKHGIELQKIGIGKRDGGFFITIHKTIVSSSSLFPPNTLISTSLLITQALQALPPSLISIKYLGTLLASLRMSLSHVIPTTTSGYLSWPDIAEAIAYENVFNHLRLLDTYILGQWSTSTFEDSRRDVMLIEDDEHDLDNKNQREIELARDDWLTDALVAVCVCAEIKGGSSAQKCMGIIFRVLVSLTHGDETWGKKVVENECAVALMARQIVYWGRLRTSAMSDGGSENGKGKGISLVRAESTPETEVDEEMVDTQSLDRLCLALGLLTNLVQVSDNAKTILRDTRLNMSCTLRKRVCIRRCSCGSEKMSQSVLDILVQLYTHQLLLKQDIKSENTPPRDTADASFLRGHLAILFGLLMLGNQENQKEILSGLSRADMGIGARANLNRLVNQAKEFVAFYATLGVVSGVPERGNDRGAEFAGASIYTERQKENKVVSDMIVFLEGLRDGATM